MLNSVLRIRIPSDPKLFVRSVITSVANTKRFVSYPDPTFSGHYGSVSHFQVMSDPDSFRFQSEFSGPALLISSQTFNFDGIKNHVYHFDMKQSDFITKSTMSLLKRIIFDYLTLAARIPIRNSVSACRS